MITRGEFWAAFFALCGGFVWQNDQINNLRSDTSGQIGTLGTGLGDRIDRPDTRLTREMVGIQNQIMASEARLAAQFGGIEHRIQRLESVHFTAKADKSK